MIESKDLQLVRIISEFGTLSTACSHLHVTQSAVSQRLAKLQSRLGIKMFERKSGQMCVTVAGQRLIDASLVVQKELDSADEFIRKLAQTRSDQLRITTQCYTLYRWLPFVLRDLRSEYPLLNVDVVPEATDQPYEALKADRIDVAILSNPDTTQPYMEQHLFDDELFAVMSSNHPLAGRSFLNPIDFSDQSLVLYTGLKHVILEEVLHPAGIKPARLIQVRITEAIVELARSGQGIAILAGWAFSDLDNTNGLSIVRISRSGMKRSWRAVFNDQCDEEHAKSLVRCVSRIGGLIREQSWRRRLQSEFG